MKELDAVIKLHYFIPVLYTNIGSQLILFFSHDFSQSI